MNEQKPESMGNADEADAKGATEDDVQKIETIDRNESLGYDGQAREEHSGQNEPVHSISINDELADNESDETPESD